MTVGTNARGRLIAAALVMSALFVWAAPASAVTPEEILNDPALEARARELSQELRCVVCQNQSIDDSNAPLAHDLRVLLRERLQSGDSDKAAMDYIVSRYGNFVLLKPPIQINTALLWAGPALAALLALFGFARYLRALSSAPAEGPADFTDDEEARLDTLLEEKNAK